jgi:hypothetical protein
MTNFKVKFNTVVNTNSGGIDRNTRGLLINKLVAINVTGVDIRVTLQRLIVKSTYHRCGVVG